MSGTTTIATAKEAPVVNADTLPQATYTLYRQPERDRQIAEVVYGDPHLTRQMLLNALEAIRSHSFGEGTRVSVSYECSLEGGTTLTVIGYGIDPGDFRRGLNALTRPAYIGRAEVTIGCERSASARGIRMVMHVKLIRGTLHPTDQQRLRSAQGIKEVRELSANGTQIALVLSGGQRDDEAIVVAVLEMLELEHMLQAAPVTPRV